MTDALFNNTQLSLANRRIEPIRFSEYRNIIDKLSEDVVRCILSVDVQEIAKDFAEQHNLSLGTLLSVVRWIMAKGEPIFDLPYAITRETGVQKNVAYQLAIDLAENILKQYAQILQIENISESVEQWKTALEKVSKGEPDPLEEKAVVQEKIEAEPRKELSTAEVQEKINKLSLETDLIKKINDAKELLDALNIYGMKKTEIYDTINKAKNLAEHLGKSQNMLEKRAVEDELRGMIDKIVSDIKEAAAAPASAEEIQNALREIL